MSHKATYQSQVEEQAYFNWKCPPMVIHKGQRVQREWATNMPISVRLAATTKGYITKQKFHEYAVSFVKYLTLFNLLG